MKLAKGLEVLTMPNPFNPFFTINLTLIFDNQDTVLIDTGYPGNLKNIKTGLINALVPYEKINKVIITHQDFDNIGSLYQLISEAKDNNIEILTHIEEKPYIEGELQPIKMTDDFIKHINHQAKQFTLKRQNELQDIMKHIFVKVNQTLNSCEELSICGGITVIHTKGHTPGHISLYLKKYKTLVAGDALTIIEGELYGPEKNTTFDMETAIHSLNQLSNYDIQKIICYHGGIYKKNCNKRITKIIEQELKELQNNKMTSN